MIQFISLIIHIHTLSESPSYECHGMSHLSSRKYIQVIAYNSEFKGIDFRRTPWNKNLLMETKSPLGLVLQYVFSFSYINQYLRLVNTLLE